MKIAAPFYAVFMVAFGMISCGGPKFDPNKDPITQMYDSMHRADSLQEWGPPTAITFAQASDTGDLDKKRITLEGYLGLGSTIWETESSVNIELWERKNQNKGNYVSISMPLGSGNNEMTSLPEKYKKTDLSLKDKSGNAATYGDKVRITGIYSEPSSDGYGSIRIQEIEKIEDTPLDYSKLGATKVTTDTANYTALDGQLVYAEGFLEIPTMLYITETVYFDLYPQAGANDYVTVDIVIGKGANMVEELPDNYGDDDIKIHDTGDKIIGKKKVRVYGVWKYNRIAAEHIEIL